VPPTIYEDGNGAWSVRRLQARELKIGPGRVLVGGTDRDPSWRSTNAGGRSTNAFWRSMNAGGPSWTASWWSTDYIIPMDQHSFFGSFEPHPDPLPDTLPDPPRDAPAAPGAVLAFDERGRAFDECVLAFDERGRAFVDGVVAAPGACAGCRRAS
jgi:hypothetical protein